MITWDNVEKNWTQFKPKIHTKWEKLTESDLTKVKTSQQELVKHIELRYKIPSTDAKRQVDEFMKAQPAGKR